MAEGTGTRMNTSTIDSPFDLIMSGRYDYSNALGFEAQNYTRYRTHSLEVLYLSYGELNLRGGISTGHGLTFGCIFRHHFSPEAMGWPRDLV